ncbi:phosphotransferase [bacterium]|nr:phosphotransferase [bacterium]
MTVESLIVDVLREGYGIRDFRIVSEHYGSQSRVWRLRANNQDFGLRQTRDLKDERLSSYCRLTHLLKENGIHVTYPIETVNGKSFLRQAGNSYVLCNWIDGVAARDRQLSIDDAQSLGRLLAKIHQVLAGFNELLPLPKSEYTYDVDTINDIKRLIAVVDAKNEKSKYDQAVHNDLKYKYAVLVSRKESSDLLAPLYAECQLVHGDLNWGNIVYTSDGQFAGLIDLDTFRYAPRMCDIVKTCMLTFNANSSYCIQFLSGYHQINPLHPTEIDAFYSLATNYMLKNIWGYREYLVNGNLHTCLNDTVQNYKLLVKDEPEYRELSGRLAFSILQRALDRC